MMKFSLPCNWQKDLVPDIKKYNEITQVYGKLAIDFIGGGRATFTLPSVRKASVKEYIREVHKAGFKFNYLLNSVCLGNVEWTAFGQKKIARLIDWLVDIEVDAVTVSIPYLLEWIKKRRPHLKVEVSSLVRINSVKRAKYWEELGADNITLSFIDVNRNFPLLRQIRKNVKCELQLIGNLLCLYNCPFFEYHAVLPSHSSQSEHCSRGFTVDYCSINCGYRKIKHPVEFIRSLWIRPEDLHLYEAIGIDRIKLVDRSMTTSALSLIINAYSQRHYEGNLLDLFYSPSKAIMLQKLNLLHKIKYLFRPFSINLFRFLNIKNLIFDDKSIYINNRSLDGFIEHFLTNDCSLVSCEECGYCDEVSRRAIKIEKAYQERSIKESERFLESMNSGSLFRYF